MDRFRFKAKIDIFDGCRVIMRVIVAMIHTHKQSLDHLYLSFVSNHFIYSLDDQTIQFNSIVVV